MKYVLSLLVLTLSLGAHACPNLAGEYICNRENTGRQVRSLITQTPAQLTVQYSDSLKGVAYRLEGAANNNHNFMGFEVDLEAKVQCSPDTIQITRALSFGVVQTTVVTKTKTGYVSRTTGHKPDLTNCAYAAK